ncbi:hypothetical protein SAMN05216297_108135 [Flavobacterium phragmitis]|uniref:Uncharacterized protein n=1 Tax=Flavobacterium phragmitis TaxID=739143 RepID=A0A1I1SXX0_9FLAO|nr:hypothetical protein SAMN05216297_108135 [Flavobacterium phragmitis]
MPKLTLNKPDRFLKPVGLTNRNYEKDKVINRLFNVVSFDWKWCFQSERR